MILFSSQASNKSAKTWIIHREMNKGLICIDFAPPQKESFFVQKNQKAENFFSQQNWTKRSMAPFNMAIKEGNLKIGAFV